MINWDAAKKKAEEIDTKLGRSGTSVAPTPKPPTMLPVVQRAQEAMSRGIVLLPRSVTNPAPAASSINAGAQSNGNKVQAARMKEIEKQIEDTYAEAARGGSIKGPSVMQLEQERKAIEAQNPSLKRPGFLEWLGKNVEAGVQGVGSGLAATYDFLLPTELIFGEEKDPMSGLNRNLRSASQETTRLADEMSEKKGGLFPAAGKLTQGTVSALPNAALALATGGASLPAQGAQLGAQGAGLGATVSAAMKSLVRNPSFLMANAQTLGNSYESAKAGGASEVEATATAIINSFLSSAVEVGGGIETLPAALARDTSEAGVRKWVRSMLEEGGEEVVQSVIESMTQKAVYDREKPIASIEDENAILNPTRMAGEFTIGAAVGGLLGGAQIGARKVAGMLPVAGGLTGAKNLGAGDGGADIAIRPAREQGVELPPVVTKNTPTTVAESAPTPESTMPTVGHIEPTVPTPVTVAPKKRRDGVQIPIEERGWEDAGNRKVNAFQYDNPHLHQFFRQAALDLQNELNATIKGERFPTLDADGNITGYTGTKRESSAPVEQAKDNAKLSYAQIQKAIEDLIADHGQENYAAAKKVELVLDDMLSNGYTDSIGQTVPPDHAYLSAREQTRSGQAPESTEFRMSEDEWASLLTHGDPGAIEQPRAAFLPGSGLGDSVGAAIGGFDPYSQLQNAKSTFHPDGEKAARQVDVPTTDFDGWQIPKSAATVMEAEATPDSAVGVIRDAIAAGEFSFDSITDVGAQAWAERMVHEKGWEGAKEFWRTQTDRGVNGKNLTALGQALLKNAMDSGDGGAIVDIMLGYTKSSTQSAQSMQAQRMLKKMSPEWKLVAVQRTVNGLQDALSKRYGSEKYTVTIDTALAEEFSRAAPGAEQDAVLDKIHQNVADQIPSTLMDKFTALRYLNMLGNLKTQVRNIAGNALMQPVRLVKDRIGAVLELMTGVKKSERTKSFVYAPSLYAAAQKDFENVRAATLGEEKFAMSGVSGAHAIDQKRTIFKNNGTWGTLPTSPTAAKVARKATDVVWMLPEGARRLTNLAMEEGDVFFSRFTYADALAGFLSARGATAQQLKNGTVDPHLLDMARAYAIREAQKATYRDNNQFSDMVSSIGFKNADTTAKRAANVALQGSIPFKKTPANVMVRGEEYSPLGLVNTAVKGAQVANGKNGVTGADVIDSLASSLTGTALFALGAALFANGVLSGGRDDDEKQAEMDNLVGRQSYALTLPSGDSFTVDWASPVSIPLFMGAELAKYALEDGFSAGDVAKAAQSITDPMLQMSMLQGVNDQLSRVSYSENPLVDLVANSVMGYLAQGLTSTLGGQLERTMETERMTTYTEKDSELSRDTQYNMGKISAKTPGWDFQQMPYIDAWGRKESTGTLPVRAAQNFFLPGYLGKENVTAADREIQRLTNAKVSENVVPSRAEKTISVRGAGKEINLNAQQYEEYATMLGQTQLEMVNALVESDGYQRMDAESKAKAIIRIYDYAKQVAGKAIAPEYELEKWVEKAQSAIENGVDFNLYLEYKDKLTKAQEIGNGSEANDAISMAMMDDSRLNKEQAGLLDKALLSDVMVINRERNVDYTNDETFVISQMSASAQRKWPGIQKKFHLSAEDYKKVYEIRETDGPTPQEKKAEIWKIVGTYALADRLYTALGKKDK